MVMGSLKQEAEVAVVGGGPGGYVAAIRAADLGKEVVLIEKREQPGGVCLLEGCIPSKALISASKLVDGIKDAKRMGITVEGLQVDHVKLRAYAQSVVNTLAKGVSGLLQKRGVQVLKGRARFSSSQTLEIAGGEVGSVEFKHCILASGSRPVMLPFAQGLDLWTSTEALALPEIPRRLLVVGGGYIGLELGMVYAALGSKVSCVEMLPELLAGADRDLVDWVARSCRKKFAKIMLESRVDGIERAEEGYAVTIAKGEKRSTETFDRVLVAVGRKPNTGEMGLENTKVALDDHGFVKVDQRQQTADPGIFAIGDITPGFGLAHKASRQGKVAAEVIAGEAAAFDNVAIPAIVFTDPELAWVGLTETAAERTGRKVRVGRFPLAALGRARTLGRTDGMTKVIADPESKLVWGVGIVGPHASELIAEAALALEMGATIEDLASTIHPHPTLSEATAEAAEVAANAAVHIFPPGGK